MIFHISYLLDDPSSVDGNEYINWALMQLDENDKPINTISGLHENVLETDSAGREMCPKNSA